ncbi:MAG: type 4a pilus biogenesis protein PilO [Oligoflexia bacterium]|nr:type 4a pilus biogenesis protein PilO [Oligoflexia bacterium]
MGFLTGLAHFQLAQVIVLGGFALGLFYFIGYNDGTVLRQTIVDIKNQVTQVEGETVKFQREIDEVKLFEQEVANNRKIIKFFLNYIPVSLTFTEISYLVNTQAQSSGVNIESKEDNQLGDDQEDSEYDILNIKLKVSGSFSQIMFFLSKLTDQERLLVVNRINLNISPESKQIMSDINLLAYRYKENIEEQEGSQGEE